MELSSIATWDGESVPDSDEFAFRMRPELATALEILGWVGKYSRAPQLLDRELSAIEGDVSERLQSHRKREQWLRDAKIKDELRRSGNGHLVCQVPRCGFDFWTRYGEIGENYIEVHHLKPLASRDNPEETKMEDLILVCANCHAMIHRDGENRDPATLIAE